MIKYNKHTDTFDSNFFKHPISNVSNNMMYGWIAAKEISIKDFNVWVEYKERASKQAFIDMF